MIQEMQQDVSLWSQQLSDLAIQCEELTHLEPAHIAQALWMNHSDLKHKVTDFKLKLTQVGNHIFNSTNDHISIKCFVIHI